MEVDVVIVGAGPSGLTAALELAAHSLSVVVIDEYYLPGGRLLGQLYQDPYAPPEQSEWNGKKVAKDLRFEAEQRGVQLFTNTTVWSVRKGWEIELGGGPVTKIKSRALLLATGSIEKALPIPGWTLPGVYSIGAAQTLTNLHRIRVGKKVLIVGVDPLSLSVMVEMKNVGIDVIGMVLPPPTDWTGTLATPMDALTRLEEVIDFAPNPLFRHVGNVMLGKFNRLITHSLRFNFLKFRGTPIYLRKAVLRIEGKEKVEAVTIGAVSVNGKLTGKTYRQEVDTVCLSGGLYPSIELAQVAGCELLHIPELGGLVPLHGPDLTTTVPGLYLSGNITGIEGAKVAMAQGKAAAVSILHYLGKRTIQSKEDVLKEIDVARENSPIHFLPDVEMGRNKMNKLWREKLHGGYDYLSM